MNNAIIIVCLAVMLVGSVLAVMLRSTIKSAVFLAVTSVALGILMLEFGSTWAALFEISVCSGFVTIVFISAISMTVESKDEQDKMYEQKQHMSLLPTLLIVGGLLILVGMFLLKFQLPFPADMGTANDDFQDVLWNTRPDMLWGMLVVLLAGAFAVAVLFKQERKL